MPRITREPDATVAEARCEPPLEARQHAKEDVLHGVVEPGCALLNQALEVVRFQTPRARADMHEQAIFLP